jgi:hypothetical protein
LNTLLRRPFLPHHQAGLPFLKTGFPQLLPTPMCVMRTISLPAVCKHHMGLEWLLLATFLTVPGSGKFIYTYQRN